VSTEVLNLKSDNKGKMKDESGFEKTLMVFAAVIYMLLRCSSTQSCKEKIGPCVAAFMLRFTAA
jgi:hypothetical protein